MRHVETKSGKSINIYDDVFELSQVTRLEEFATNSLFKLGWNDLARQDRNEAFIHSKYSQQDLMESGVLDALNKSEVADELSAYYITQAILNLSTPADSHMAHTHSGSDRVCLIYVNGEWGINWHGETLFYDESAKDIELALPYTVNRVVMFDPLIPHTIRPQSHASHKFRFTLALMLNKK